MRTQQPHSQERGLARRSGKRLSASGLGAALALASVSFVGAGSVGAAIPGAAPANPTEACTWNWNNWRSSISTDGSEADLVDPLRGGIFTQADNDLGVNSWYAANRPADSTETGVIDGVTPNDNTDDNVESWYGVGYFELEPGEEITLTVGDTQYWESHVFAAFDSSGTQIGRYPDQASVDNGFHYIASVGSTGLVATAGGIERPRGGWSDSFTLTAPDDGILYLHYLLTDDGARAESVTSDACRAFDDISFGHSPGTNVTVDVVANDPNANASTVAIVGADPVTGNLVVDNEGTWSADPSSGAITFTPETGFTGDPTPIDYTVEVNGTELAAVSVTVGYTPVLAPDVSFGHTSGTAVTIDVLANDPSNDLDPATVAIVGADPVIGDLVVDGEGTWSVDLATGAITFTPEDGFAGDPTPISYSAEDDEGNVANAVAVTVGYIPVTAPDESLNNAECSTVAIDVLANDPSTNIDPASVVIDDPGYEATAGVLAVSGEGTWIVDPSTGVITFTAEAGFTGNPTPISYTVMSENGTTSAPVTVTITCAPVTTGSTVAPAAPTATTVAPTSTTAAPTTTAPATTTTTAPAAVTETSLPTTGSSTLQLVAVAFVLMAGGSALVVSTRRRIV